MLRKWKKRGATYSELVGNGFVGPSGTHVKSVWYTDVSNQQSNTVLAVRILKTNKYKPLETQDTESKWNWLGTLMS